MAYVVILVIVTTAVLVAGHSFTVPEIWSDPGAALNLLQSRARVGAPTTYKPHAKTKRRSTGRTRYTIETFVYGKYFANCRGPDTNRLDPRLCQDDGMSRDRMPNTVHVWSPEGEEASRPIVVHAHGGAFIGGSSWADPEAESYDPPFVESLLDNGIVFASVNYRILSTTYQYEDSASVVRNEEFVSAGEDGTLSLNPQHELADYKPLMGWQELMPKCIYDASRALEYLLVNAAKLRIDPNRVAFHADSAGTAMATYLSLVYPTLPGHPTYKVVSLSSQNVQINYPFLPLLSSGWAKLAEELGDDAPLSTVISKENCPHIFGHIQDNAAPPDGGLACPRPEICNISWSENADSMFCGDRYASTTFGSLRQMLAWPLDSPYRRGLAKFWNMADYFRNLRREENEPPLMVWIRNIPRDSMDANSLIHSPLWAREYGRVLETMPRKTVQYVIYNGDAPGMPTHDQGDPTGDAYHCQSSFDWSAEVVRHTGVSRPSATEIALFHCVAMGLSCAV